MASAVRRRLTVLSLGIGRVSLLSSLTDDRKPCAARKLRGETDLQTSAHATASSAERRGAPDPVAGAVCRQPAFVCSSHHGVWRPRLSSARWYACQVRIRSRQTEAGVDMPCGNRWKDSRELRNKAITNC
jgi:hypothetical protein